MNGTKNLSEGDFMIEGQHYLINPNDFPKGLTFQVRILDRQRAELSWIGNAALHHVNESKAIPLTFTKEAFVAASEKAFTVENEDWLLRLQYGQGYKMSGSIQATQGTIQIKELSTNGTVTIDAALDDTFTLPTKLENKEPYTLQITEHPAGQCCYFKTGDGIAQGHDIQNLQITCKPAQLDIPGGLNQSIMTSNTLLTTGLTQGLGLITSANILPEGNLSKNQFGDGAFIWGANVNETPSKFVSVYNTNTNTWSHPQQTAQTSASSVYSNGLQAFTDGITKTTIRDDKGVNVSLSIENQTNGGANLAQYSMGNPNHLIAAQNLQYNYNNYEFIHQDNGLWSKTVLKEGNKRIIKLIVDGIAQNTLVIRYNLLENFDPNRNQYNPSEKNYSKVIDRTNMESDFQPYINAKVDPKGHGLMVWTTQTKISNTQFKTNLFMVEIQNHLPLIPLNEVSSINVKPLTNQDPQFHVDERGNMLLVWTESYTEGSVSRITINKQEKNNKFPMWNPLHSENAFTTTDFSQTQIADVKEFDRFTVHSDMNQHGDFMIAWTENPDNNIDLHGMVRRFYTDQSSASIHSDFINTKIYDSNPGTIVDTIDPNGFDVQVNDQKTFTVAYQVYDSYNLLTQAMTIAHNIVDTISDVPVDAVVNFGTHGQYEQWDFQSTADNPNVPIPMSRSFVNFNLANNGNGTRSWYHVDFDILVLNEETDLFEPAEQVRVQLITQNQQAQTQVVDDGQISLEENLDIKNVSVKGIMNNVGCGTSKYVIEATTTNGQTAFIAGGSQ